MNRFCTGGSGRGSHDRPAHRLCHVARHRLSASDGHRHVLSDPREQSGHGECSNECAWHCVGRGCHGAASDGQRSEEHTSELQSLMRISYAVFCLKKKKTTTKYTFRVRRHEKQPKQLTNGNRKEERPRRQLRTTSNYKLI